MSWTSASSGRRALKLQTKMTTGGHYILERVRASIILKKTFKLNVLT